MTTPSLTVIIPSYRRVERLGPLVERYRSQGADEIIVVLDGPHPDWRARLPLDDAVTRVIELESNAGLALARIAGLRAASGEVILTVDDDVEPAVGLVQRHRDFHATHDDMVLQGYMPVALPTRRGHDDAPSYLYARDYRAQVEGWRRGDATTILRSLWGGNVSLSRELYLRAEAVKSSQRLEYNEDLDLGIRLLALDAGAVFDERALAAHHHSRGLDAYLRECFARGGAVADLEARWGERPAQLTPLVEIPPSYHPILRRLQRSIAGRDAGGLAQGFSIATYRVAGCLRWWRLQDAVTRLLRRGLVMRGYRLASAG